MDYFIKGSELPNNFWSGVTFPGSTLEYKARKNRSTCVFLVPFEQISHARHYFSLLPSVYYSSSSYNTALGDLPSNLLTNGPMASIMIWYQNKRQHSDTDPLLLGKFLSPPEDIDSDFAPEASLTSRRTGTSPRDPHTLKSTLIFHGFVL